jgi:hypothetical protein
MLIVITGLTLKHVFDIDIVVVDFLWKVLYYFVIILMGDEIYRTLTSKT